jgi:hypothetical protein
MDTYERGVMIGLNWQRLTVTPDEKWRWRFPRQGAEGDINAILIGYVPYENIESVDWDGDRYYSEPHLYCHFDANRKELYENLAFCVRHKTSDGRTYYSEVAPYGEVKSGVRKGIGSDGLW